MEQIIGEQPLTNNDAVIELEIDNEDTPQSIETEQTSTDGSPIGKFKSVEALYSAYNNLQAEFTKKCQKLSELQKSVEQNCEMIESSPVLDYMSEDWECQVSNFLKIHPEAKDYASKISEEKLKEPSLSLEQSYDRVLAREYREPKKLIEDDEFLNTYIFNSEKIKNKVLQDYFSSLENNPIPTLMSKGAGAITAGQPEKVDSLVEAGKLAINLFK